MFLGTGVFFALYFVPQKYPRPYSIRREKMKAKKEATNYGTTWKRIPVTTSPTMSKGSREAYPYRCIYARIGVEALFRRFAGLLCAYLIKYTPSGY